jgi:phosphotransferase family enzyme
MPIDDAALADRVVSMVGETRGGVARMTRRPYAYRTSFPLQELDVEFEDGSRLGLIWKNLDREALEEPAREAKPEFVHDPMREIVVYRDVLASSRLGTATYYGSLVDPAERRFWLFIEKVPGVELWQIGETDTWEEVARWLATLHEQSPAFESPHLLMYDGDFFIRWLERALEFVGSDVLSEVAAKYDEVVEMLLALPQSFVHGEFYASNVLVAHGGDAPRVCPIDWEMAGVGPSLLDVAALTTGRWSDDEKLRLARAYAAALAGPPPEDELASALDACRLHIAVQWLGWARKWTPPEEHVQDWLGEARGAAERLGL